MRVAVNADDGPRAQKESLTPEASGRSPHGHNRQRWLCLSPLGCQVPWPGRIVVSAAIFWSVLAATCPDAQAQSRSPAAAPAAAGDQRLSTQTIPLSTLNAMLTALGWSPDGKWNDGRFRPSIERQLSSVDESLPASF